jgi:addiction module HigA family antidote
LEASVKEGFAGGVAPDEVLLKDVLKPMGIARCRLANSIKVPASRIHDVVHGKRPINAGLALRQAWFFGTDAQPGSICRRTMIWNVPRSHWRRG